jgi:glycosyltransferase involved in cell wall biosynthesis
MRVCYVLAYRDPDYIRTRSLLAALKLDPAIEILRAKQRSRSLARYAQMLTALLRIHRTQAPDIYLLGFRGHEVFWLVRRIVGRKPLVFDAMMSPHLALTEERKAGWLGAMLALLWRPIEMHALRSADLVLTDTALHARAYVEHFGVAPERILPLPVGAFEPASQPRPQGVRGALEPLRVLFYGSFLPLHGVDVIVRAAAAVRDLPLQFRFIGGSARQAQRLQAACAQHGVQNWTHTRWMPFEQLVSEEIPAADLCLGGPFGDTPQARRVVTGKTSQCLALGRVTIVGAIAFDYGLRDRENCLLVPQGDADSLAAALRWAHAHRERLPTIAAAGQELYAQRLSVAAIARELLPALHRLTDKRAGA